MASSLSNTNGASLDTSKYKKNPPRGSHDAYGCREATHETGFLTTFLIVKALTNINVESCTWLIPLKLAKFPHPHHRLSECEELFLYVSAPVSRLHIPEHGYFSGGICNQPSCDAALPRNSTLLLTIPRHRAALAPGLIRTFPHPITDAKM